MSNCVLIHTHLQVSSEYFDIQKLMDDIEDYSYVDEPDFDRFFAPWATDEEFYFYWFIGKGNFYLTPKGKLEMVLGAHRSTHTERDLRSLQHFLGKYVKKGHRLIIPVSLSNEYDGFKEQYDSHVAFENP